MKLALSFLASLGIALPLGPALAAKPGGRVAGQVFMISDKTITGVTGGVGFGRFRLDGELQLGWTTDERSQESLDGGSFFGIVLGFHGAGRVYQDRSLAVDIGSGIDIWWLTAIHEEESKLALPLMAEASYRLAGPLTARVGARYYLLSSDGLMVGRKWEGGDALPVFLTVALGGEWR